MRNYYKSGDWNGCKTCSVCEQELEASLFYKQKDGKFGLASRCKKCLLESNKKWSINNKQKRLEYSRKQRQDPTKYEKMKEACQKWRRNNLEHDAERQRQRKARVINAVPSWYEQEVDKVALVYKKAKELGLTVDHIVPLKNDRVCGLHTWANLQLLENSLNCKKRNLWWPDA